MLNSVTQITRRTHETSYYLYVCHDCIAGRMRQFFGRYFCHVVKTCTSGRVCFNNARKRNAGRVSLGLKYQGGYGKIPLAEIKARMKEIGAAAVAKELGVSRRTLYYRIKEAEENGFDEIV